MPDWIRSMPARCNSGVLGNQEVRTLKHCVPFIDALAHGVLILLPCDIEISNGRINWDWDPPVIIDAPISRSPIGVHVPEQAAGSPFVSEDELIIKFINFWTLQSPLNTSLLFTHPFNRHDLPFTTLSGVVDTDHFHDGYVHFPAILDKSFEGVIARGTPVAQVSPVARTKIELETATMTDSDIASSANLQDELAETPGVYRKKYRQRS